MRNSELVQPVPAAHKRGRLVLIVAKRCGRSVVKLVVKLLISCFGFKHSLDEFLDVALFITERLNKQFINGFVHQFFHTPRRAVHNQTWKVVRLILGSLNGELSL